MLYIILVQGFCPLKIKITQFPDGLRLNHLFNCCSANKTSVLSKLYKLVA